MLRGHAILPVLVAFLAAPAQAESAAVDVPAGRAGDAAIAIARQMGISIVITDPGLADRRIPAIRGRLSADAAVRRLARAAGASAIKAGASSWRLVPGEKPRPARQRDSEADRAAAPPPREAAPTAPPVEIIVIGSKRDTPLSDYPGQVTIVEGASLSFGGAGGTEKLVRSVPTLTSTHLGSGRNKLFVRGIADSSFTGPTQSTVGQYFGDLRLSYNAPDPDLHLSDLDRVEVLEGPQGTLYGAGSLGGIIRMVPNAPEPGITSGSAMVGGSATQHGALGSDASAVLNLPLVGESATLRLNIDADTQGGYIDKPLLGRNDVNRTTLLSGRAALRLDAGDGWTVDVTGIGKTTDGHDSQYADRDGVPLTRAASVAEGFSADYAQGQLVVSGEFGEAFFRSSTGITWQALEETYDATQPGGEDRIFVQSNDTDMVANETRLWKPLHETFGWLAGISYVRNRAALARALGAPGALLPTTGVLNAIDEVTLYGEASVKLFEGLVVSAGGRVTYSWLGGAGEDIQFASLTEADTRLLAAATADRRESAFLPSVSLVASVMEKTTLYFRYQEGFRPGGLAVTGNFVSRFRNDHVATMEFGGRHGQAGRTPFDIAANVSFTRWTNIQADFIDNAGLPSTANIGDGRIWSATLTAGLQANDALRLEAGLTVNNSQVDEPVLLMFAGRVNQIPNIAEFSGRLGFEYARPVGRDLDFAARGWAHYVGRSRLGVGPELGELQGDYLDSGLTLRLGREAFGVTLGITNITDEKGNRFALGTPFAIGRDQVTPLRPRTVRLGLDAAF